MLNARERRSVARGLKASEALPIINAAVQKAVHVPAEPTASVIVKTTVQTATSSVPTASNNEPITKSPGSKKRSPNKSKVYYLVCNRSKYQSL